MFVFRSRPQFSLTCAQERLAFRSLAALSFTTGGAFAYPGYWPVLPFVGLEVGLLAWAFRALRSREGNYEHLTIDGDRVVLEWRCGPREERRELNRQWIRVTCDCSAPGRDCRLSVSCCGRETEVGQYLSDEGRVRLASALQRQLRA